MFDPSSEIDVDDLLSRKQLAEALTERGFKTAEATLATMASRGGGPRFQKYGQRVLYKWGDALAWAKSKLSVPVLSTSEFRLIASATKRQSAPRVSALQLRNHLYSTESKIASGCEGTSTPRNQPP
jgi:hypothetical protein